MADPLELQVTVVPVATELFAYGWLWGGLLGGLTEAPSVFNSAGYTSVVHSTNCMFPLAFIMGTKGALKRNGYFGDKYGQLFPENFKSSVKWNSYPANSTFYDCMDYANPGASIQQSLCNVQKHWGVEGMQPYLPLKDFAGENPEPPGLQPPCQGGDGSERPDYGMIYPRKI